jgi:hypothetical protein
VLYNTAGSFGQVSLRPQVGVNFAQLDYKSVHGAIQGRAGFHIGADLQIGSPFFVQPGLQFSSTKLAISDFGEVSVQELNVPVMLGFKLFAGKNSSPWGVRVFGGPEFSYAVNKKIDAVFTDINKEDIKNFQVAGLIGAGVDLSILFLDMGYKIGLSDYIETDKASTSVDYFYLNAGLRIGF